LVYIHNLTL